MEFSRPEYWSGLLFPSPGDLPNPGIEPRSPALQAESLPAEPRGKPNPNGTREQKPISLWMTILPPLRNTMSPQGLKKKPSAGKWKVKPKRRSQLMLGVVCKGEKKGGRMG